MERQSRHRALSLLNSRAAFSLAHGFQPTVKHCVVSLSLPHEAATVSTVGGDLSARALASWTMWRRVVVEADRETWVCEEETSIFFFKKFLDKKPDNYL